MIEYLRAALIAVLLLHCEELFLNHAENLVLVGQNRLKLLNKLMKFLQFSLNLIAFETLETAKLHRKNCCRLNFTQAKALHQSLIGIIIRFANRLNNFINMIDCNLQTFEDMSTILCLLELKFRPTTNNFLAVLNKLRQNILQAEQFRHATFINQCQNIVMESRLQASQLVKLVQNLLRESILLKVNHDTNLATSRLIARIRNMIKLLCKHELTNLINKAFLAHTIRHLGHNDAMATILVLFNMSNCTNRDRTATSLISLHHWCATINLCTRWEIRTLYILHQFLESNVRIINLSDSRIDQFAKVMRWNIRRHTDRNTHLAIQENVWHCCRQHDRLLLCTIEVVAEINRILLNIGQHLNANLVHAGLSIARCCWLITVHRTEVTLTLNERIAHLPRLSKVHHRHINRRITMWVVFTHYFTDDTRGLNSSMWSLPAVLIHCIQDTAVNRLQTIAYIWKRTINQDRHRIAKETILHHILNRQLFYAISAAFRLETTNLNNILIATIFRLYDFTLNRFSICILEATKGFIYAFIISRIRNIADLTLIKLFWILCFFFFFLLICHFSFPPRNPNHRDQP